MLLSFHERLFHRKLGRRSFRIEENLRTTVLTLDYLFTEALCKRFSYKKVLWKNENTNADGHY